VPADAPYPFPGLNPYFEKEWFQVHPTMIALALSRLQRQMPHDLRVSIEQGMKISTRTADSKSIQPDVSIWKVREDTLLDSAPPNFAPPVILEVTTPKPRHLVIRDSEENLITVIELLSPSNKHGSGAVSYLQKRQGLIEASVNLVEVDLIRRWGLSLVQFEEAPAVEALLASGGSLPPHAVTVLRSELPLQREIYAVIYSKTLPAIRVPMRADDQDVWLNLQEIAEQCHTDCAFDKTTDYTRDPEPPLTHEDATWLDTYLKSKQLR